MSDTSTVNPMPLLQIWCDGQLWFAENPPSRGYGSGGTARAAVADLRLVIRRAE